MTNRERIERLARIIKGSSVPPVVQEDVAAALALIEAWEKALKEIEVSETAFGTCAEKALALLDKDS